MSRTDPPLRIAVWLEVPPRQPLLGEGIPTHLARLLEVWGQQSRHNVMVYTPAWNRAQTETYIKGYNLARFSNIRFTFVPSRFSWFDAWAGATQNAPGKDAPPADAAPRKQALALHRRLLHGALRLAHAAYARLPKKLHAAAWNGIRQFLDYGLGRRMAETINRDGADVCLLPQGDRAMARHVRMPLVACIPDVICVEFPELFAASEIRRSLARFRAVAARAEAVISVSNHVKDAHVVRHLSVAPPRAHAVPHAPMALDGFLPRDPARRIAAYITDEMASNPGQRRILGVPEWRKALADPGLHEGGFLYYPTQYRPYKGIEDAARGLHLYNRLYKEDRPLRLILTCDPTPHPSLMALIADNDLFATVLPFARLPPDVHASFCARARFVVTASHFEGGFPFMFSEALSVGSPVLMNRIPVTTETLPEALWNTTLFAANSPEDMARRLARALPRRDKILAYQKDFYATLRRRAWSDVAAEFIAIARAAIANPQNRAASS